MTNQKNIFTRTELLIGREALKAIREQRVILFGVGGVGSWCAESLIRSGIMHLTLVDSDRVCITNVNRQLMATSKTVGEVKVDILKQRLLDINPDAQIEAIETIYSHENAHTFQLSSYDFIIDAIDSLSNKVNLIRTATNTSATLISSMGAALKLDPTRIKVADFWKVKGCPLAAALRKRIRKGEKLKKNFLCVYSDEILPNIGQAYSSEKAGAGLPPSPDIQGWNARKAQINGTMAHVTASFGFMMAGLVIQNILQKSGFGKQ